MSFLLILIILTSPKDYVRIEHRYESEHACLEAKAVVDKQGTANKTYCVPTTSQQPVR